MIAVAAMDINRNIGYKGSLPWPKNKEDLAFFKKITENKSILIGHNTFKTLPKLKNRKIFVLTHNPRSSIREPDINYEVNFVNENDIPDDVIICGGAEIYKKFLPKCDSLYLTIMRHAYDGDTKMPAFENEFVFKELLVNNLQLEIIHYGKRN